MHSVWLWLAGWSLLAPALLGGDWPMLGHDASRSGGTPDAIRPPFARKWYRLFPDEGLQSGVQPVIAKGRVYVGTLAGALHALDAESGQDVWSFRAAGPVLHAAAVADGKVFFGSADGVIHALQESGDLAWTVRTEAAVWNAAAVHEGLVLIGSRDGRLYAIEAATGRTRWTFDTGAPLLNSPAVDARRGRVYVGSEAMRVHAVALVGGHEVWRSERLPGCSMRGYHPVIAPDGAVLVTTQPVIGYDRFQALLLDMVRTVFGDFASWRHSQEENAKLRAENLRLMDKPGTYPAQLEYLRRRLTQEPAFQTLFVLDPTTGGRRFVAPVVASESMNGPGAPPVVTGDGRVIVKYQVLLRSRYEHYSPLLNVGYLDTTTGDITPIMDQSRTYGWHDSLLLVHDEQCQLSLAGSLLLNAHQDNVNALDLQTLRGEPQPLALNIHEPEAGQALAIRLDAWRGRQLPAGAEWLIRGTAVYGGGSVLDVPVAIAGDTFYYVPTHELNAGCAVIAYRMAPGTAAPKKPSLPPPHLADDEWRRIQDLPWDWDTLTTPRLKNLPDGLPGPVPGTAAAPLTDQAQKAAGALPDAALDKVIWTPAFEPAAPAPREKVDFGLRARLEGVVRELISRSWRPLICPAGKAPEESYRFFNDPSETLYTLLLARPWLDTVGQRQVDAHLAPMVEAGLRRTYEPQAGESRVPYDTPVHLLQLVEDSVRDDLARLYPLWLWSRTPAGAGFTARHWAELRGRLEAPPGRVVDDGGNARLAGLIAYCRLARAAGDEEAVARALPVTRQALRTRLEYSLAHTRGGVLRTVPNGRMVCARWRRLTPDLGRFLATHAGTVEARLIAVYADHQRPGWWLAWNVEQLMRNEAPFQLPTTPLEIFTARALILGEPAGRLRAYIDLPWCRADEFYIQKLALTLQASAP